MSKTTRKSQPETAAGLARALDFVPQGLAVFDPDMRLGQANGRYGALLDLPARLTAPGTPLYDIALSLAQRGDLGAGDPLALALGHIQALTGAATTIATYRRPDGQVLELHAARLPEGGLAISALDVTARMRAEEELAQLNMSLERRMDERMTTLLRLNSELETAKSKADAANRDKTRFLAAASHDLLQPLNAARLYTSTLIERAGGTSLAGLAHSIEASLNAVEEIMSALLDISRIDSGALKPASAPFAVKDLFKKIEVEFAPMARERAVKLKLVGSSATVMADRALVARIVQNLVSNAIKYTKPGGRVLVGCRRRGQRLRIDVIDTGIGINRDQHALIFAEFSRLDPGARMAQGLGLGLSIVQRLVTAMNLGLDLDSVEGKGSRFSLFLPTAKPVRASVETGLPTREPVSNLTGLKVLCVDNERSILDAMEGLLQGWGVDVRSARSLKDISQARLLEGWLPDLVLMDYHLDQTSGLDAIEWLRQNVGGHLPAALITADRTPAVRTLAEDRGVTVIAKPVKPAALRATLSGLTSQRGR